MCVLLNSVCRFSNSYASNLTVSLLNFPSQKLAQLFSDYIFLLLFKFLIILSRVSCQHISLVHFLFYILDFAVTYVLLLYILREFSLSFHTLKYSPHFLCLTNTFPTVSSSLSFTCFFYFLSSFMPSVLLATFHIFSPEF